MTSTVAAGKSGNGWKQLKKHLMAHFTVKFEGKAESMQKVKLWY